MKIVIFVDPDAVRGDALDAAVHRVLLRGRPNATHAIHVGHVRRDGEQETLIVFDADQDGHFTRGSMTVCQLQRHPGAPLEYHS